MNIAIIIELFQVYLTDQLLWNYRGSRNKINQFIAWYVTVLRGTGWSMMGYCGYYVTALDRVVSVMSDFRSGYWNVTEYCLPKWSVFQNDPTWRVINWSIIDLLTVSCWIATWVANGRASNFSNKVLICHKDTTNAARNRTVQNIFLINCFEARIRGGPCPEVYSQKSRNKYRIEYCLSSSSSAPGFIRSSCEPVARATLFLGVPKFSMGISMMLSLDFSFVNISGLFQQSAQKKVTIEASRGSKERAKVAKPPKNHC